MTEERVPVEVVRGSDEVTLWLWPNTHRPVTVKMPVRQFAKIERKAERVADGDLGRVIGKLLVEDVGRYLEA